MNISNISTKYIFTIKDEFLCYNLCDRWETHSAQVLLWQCSGSLVAEVIYLLY